MPINLELVYARAVANLLERAVQFIEIELVLEHLGEGILAIAGAAGGRVAPAAGPAHAVIREDQHIVVGRVRFDGPGGEIDQRGAVGHVELAQLLHSCERTRCRSWSWVM